MKKEKAKKKEDPIQALRRKYINGNEKASQPKSTLPENFFKVERVGSTHLVRNRLFINLFTKNEEMPREICLIFSEDAIKFFLRRLAHNKYKLKETFDELKLDDPTFEKWKKKA